MNSNIIALIVTLVVWQGLFVFMLGLDKKVKQLERENREK